MFHTIITNIENFIDKLLIILKIKKEKNTYYDLYYSNFINNNENDNLV